MDYEALLKDHEDVKKKLDASKARNKSLSTEVKSLKLQNCTLMEKGKHDDELVDALLVRKKKKSLNLLYCNINCVFSNTPRILSKACVAMLTIILPFFSQTSVAFHAPKPQTSTNAFCRTFSITCIYNI